MIREAIGTGETEMEALADAKAQLGLDESVEVQFEVIQRATKKVLGLFGGSPAKVKVTVENNNTADVAEDFLKNVLNAMNLKELEITSEKNEDSAVFNIEGEDVGFVIGRRGETLDALQYLTSLVANHVENSYFKVTVNTGNYREKRENTLEILGRKLAFKAAKTGKKTVLEPMNPYERRIIHTAVQKVRGAISWSEGENANRHVVIGPDPKGRNNRNYNNRNRNSKPRNYGSVPTNTDRKPLDESNGAGLYGRID
jgi:spoIIIJ-associated protein